MARCKGANKDGSRCKRLVANDCVYCAQHEEQQSFGELLVLGAGAVLGHAVAPGVGGAVGGAIAAKVISSLFDEPRRKPRVFVSFDFDNDKGLKHLLVGQTQRGDAPFEIVDSSLKEAAPERNWQSKARRSIKGSDLVVVLLGRHTYRAPGVLAEVAMARETGVPTIQLLAKRSSGYRRIPGAGPVLAWSHDNLTRLFDKK